MKTKSILIGVAVAFLLFSVFSFNFGIGVKGSGKVIKEIRKVETFTSIDAGSAFDITVVKGDVQKLQIETDDNVISLIKTKVKNGELIITTKGNINNPTKMEIKITMAKLKGIDLSGACTLSSDSRFESPTMEIEQSGASSSKLKISCSNLKVELSGSSDASLVGYAASVNAEISGASSLKAYNLDVENADIDCSGAASAKIKVSKSISGEASGASSIYYKGNPTRVNISTSGVGSVSKK